MPSDSRIHKFVFGNGDTNSPLSICLEGKLTCRLTPPHLPCSQTMAQTCRATAASSQEPNAFRERPTALLQPCTGCEGRALRCRVQSHFGGNSFYRTPLPLDIPPRRCLAADLLHAQTSSIFEATYSTDVQSYHVTCIRVPRHHSPSVS